MVLFFHRGIAKERTVMKPFKKKLKTPTDCPDTNVDVSDDPTQVSKGLGPVKKAEKLPGDVRKKSFSAPVVKTERKARLSCDITRPLHRKLRVAAAKEDTTMVAVIEKLIDTGIQS